VQAIAQHSNGINQVNLYLNDSLRSTQSGHTANQYIFSYQLQDAAGPAHIKITAIAKVTGTIGSDSVNIVVEGVVLGKKSSKAQKY